MLLSLFVASRRAGQWFLFFFLALKFMAVAESGRGREWRRLRSKTDNESGRTHLLSVFSESVRNLGAWERLMWSVPSTGGLLSGQLAHVFVAV